MPTGDNTVDKTIESMDREKLEKLLDRLTEADKKKPEHLEIPKLNFEKGCFGDLTVLAWKTQTKLGFSF